METVHSPKPLVFDFMHFDKKEIDWRYITADHLGNIAHKDNAPHSTTINWVGIVPLEIARESPTQAIISFINYHQRLTTDKAYTRGADGAPGNCLPISYNLNGIASHLRFDAKYLNLLLEEKVDRHGVHSVSLLWNTLENKPYAFYSDELWHTQSEDMITYYTKIDPNTVDRKALLSNHRYNWMK